MRPVFALGAACVACCALTAVAPLLASIVVLPLSGSSGVGIAAVGVSAALAILLLYRRRSRVPCDVDSSCACSGPIGLNMATAGDGSAPSMTCMLGSGEIKARIGQFRELAERALLSVRRERLRLHLVYAIDAAPDVRNLMRQEESCCAFLDLDIREQADGVHVTITAPKAAADSVLQLFALFAPNSSKNSQYKELAAS